MLSPSLALCRPHQYIKNLFIFAPAFFAHSVNDVASLWPILLAFVAWCLGASGIYIINDLRDVADDRRHPRKRLRPIASGAVSRSRALLLVSLLLPASLVIAALWVPAMLPLLGFYLLMNLGYCFWLKAVSLVDVLLISLGFVLRLYAGGAAADVPLSKWIVIITFLLALFLALAKRRDDVVLSEVNDRRMRAAIAGYNRDFLGVSMALVAAIAIVAYLMYCISAEVVARVGNEHLFFTALFVLLGFLRYLQITFVEERSGSPTKVVLGDRFLQVVILLWFSCFAVILYL